MGTVGIMLEWTPLWLKRDLNASLYGASLSILCWGGGEFIGIFEIFSVTQSLINGICVPPPTKMMTLKSSTVQNFPLA